MKDSKYTLIVNYVKMSPGGIEVTFAYLIKYALEHEYRVIWITNEAFHKKAMFKEIIDYEKLEIVYITKLNQLFGIKIDFSSDENVVMISCVPDKYITAEAIRKSAVGVQSFQHYLILAHYTGELTYPDRHFKGIFLHRCWFRYMRSIAVKLEEADSIRAFSMKHLTSYEEYYGICIKEKQRKLLGRTQPIETINENEWERKSIERNEKFNIISCSRFDFPHKGYIIGLIKAFGELKGKYPQLTLTLVGYGSEANEALVQDTIAGLNEETQKDIMCVGMLDYEQLNSYLRNAHLSVGLAGALLDGARCGVPSLVMRHYCYEAETYGLFEECFEGGILRDEPGYAVIPYVETVLNMRDEEYVNCCKKTFTIMEEEYESPYYPSYIFEQNGVTERVLSKTDLLKGNLMRTFIKIKQICKKQICKKQI